MPDRHGGLLADRAAYERGRGGVSLSPAPAAQDPAGELAPPASTAAPAGASGQAAHG